MIDLLARLVRALRALPGLPVRLAEAEMRLADIEHDMDRVDAIVDELYLGPRERAA